MCQKELSIQSNLRDYAISKFVRICLKYNSDLDKTLPSLQQSIVAKPDHTGLVQNFATLHDQYQMMLRHCA